MIDCIIIEDQPPAQRVLQKYIGDMDNMNLKATFADAIQGLAFLKTESVDLIFLDIHLPKISGIDFLKSLNNRPNVILTTAFSEYALESYEYAVLDYLLKPFSFERFVQAVSKVTISQTELSQKEKELNSTDSTDIIFIKSGYEHIKINISDILFIQSDADYTEIFTVEKKHLSQEPLRHWEGILDSKKFIRIHKSYIINIARIEKISGNLVRLNEKTALPIGRAFKEDFMKRVLH
ncbi:response regulator transcription factor [Aurantibacter crassamenti]|uniref:LytR/AlgR family response regulator transcription factor n=1 Tax=Aurantibacter crassamenti TaxID=1837375 RepID=UPI001939F354|nr:LytTR family DNA-binding domain-containing protein [Aurantibacter crassamenti]MBM1106218.1 response regulator transcription factor [Aurantibacter crassamenti]